MTTIRSLAEVSACLEKTVSTLPVRATNAAELFDRYEEIAIEVLDSEFGNYTPGTLEEYLETYLYLKQLEERLGRQAVENVTTEAQRKGTIYKVLKEEFSSQKAR